MKSSKLLLLITCVSGMLFSFSACEKDVPVPTPNPETQGIVEIRFVPTMNGAAFQPNTLFIGPNQFRMNLENFKFYLSDISLENSSETRQLSEIALIDFSQTDKSLRYKTDPGTFQKLSFAVGVKKSLNGTGNPDFDEAQFPIDHPLSIYNGMYWSWATGYIFSKVEGKIDTSAAQNQTPTFSWFYHSGLDTCYTPRSLENLSIQINPGQTTVVELGIDVNDLFISGTDTLNMVENYFTHTTDDLELAKKVITNLANGIRKL